MSYIRDVSRDWKALKPVLVEAHRLLCNKFGRYLGTDSLGLFDVSDQGKNKLMFGGDVLGSFDAWKDRVSLTVDHDPIGTAVHELLHANSFSDDWTPRDLGRRDDLISFRGLEIQWLSAKRQRVKGIYHRGLNEGVTEFFTLWAYKKAVPAYVALLPIAQMLVKKIGFRNVAQAYFRGGYEELEKMSVKISLNLDLLDAEAESVLQG